MVVSQAVMEMCRVIKEMGELGDFSSTEVINRMLPPKCVGRTQRSYTVNLRGRFNRIVRAGGVIPSTASRDVPGHHAIGAHTRYVVGPALEALIEGNSDLARSLATVHPVHALYAVWGIQLPENFYAKRYPHARVYRQRME